MAQSRLDLAANPVFVDKGKTLIEIQKILIKIQVNTLESGGTSVVDSFGSGAK
jgi:hypothetical protein